MHDTKHNSFGITKSPDTDRAVQNIIQNKPVPLRV